ncbi:MULTISPECIES: TraB/GumN family protein [unclassified Aureimonas]|uniref:TraB/GumN family protein n=1 Tax=unclassified Aureimonas TaxID=2615206 RepID=UPI0006FE7E00|nr:MULTISPECIES: TraB/GumN family protein [unclassified Aureimonas]KQT52630.1 hypothetical protein ASG62_15630 [Aureimonas sp. Leaf427]KQT77471.1 hypothetical protein ASG54_10780 [Aureimonas sp. Leaf460]
MTSPSSLLKAASRLLLGLALLVPMALLLAVAVVALSAPARAEEPAPAAATCPGTSLLPRLRETERFRPLLEKAEATPNGRGKLFRIEREGLAPSYLYGTMHMTDPRVLALEPQADSALDGAGRLVIETTDVLKGPSAQLAVLARPDLLNLPAGKRLGDYLTPEMRGKVEAKLLSYGIPFGSVETLQPWFFSVGLLLPACEMQRQAAGAEVLDVSLATRAEKAGKPVLGLETAVEQLEAMGSLSMDLQVQTLLATLELKPQMPDIFETMIELYLSGDIATISAVAEAAMPLSEVPEESVAAYTEFEDRIIETRNHTMATRLQPILKEGGAFVAVGALHLPGEAGLVELLRKAGYRVTRAD